MDNKIPLWPYLVIPFGFIVCLAVVSWVLPQGVLLDSSVVVFIGLCQALFLGWIAMEKYTEVVIKKIQLDADKCSQDRAEMRTQEEMRRAEGELEKKREHEIVLECVKIFGNPQHDREHRD